MKNFLLKTLWFYLLIILLPGKAFADHITGEDMAMIPINKPGANYILILNLYVDENYRNLVGREQEQAVQIYRKRDGKYIAQFAVRAYVVPIKHLSYTNEKCAESFNLRQYRIRFEREVMLDPNIYNDPGGYFIIHDRCCRAKDISSISKPEEAAVSTRLEFPSLKDNPAYASTEFGFPNGEYLCVNKPFQMNFNVRNPENKELRFSLVEPLGGFTKLGTPNINNPPATFRSLPKINWKPGFTFSNLIPASQALAVDRNTGVITVTPATAGVYVFGVMVEEYKNGVKTGSNIRDFSFVVLKCPDTKPPDPVITYLGNQVKQIEVCAGATVKLETQNNSNLNFTWQNNGDNITGQELSNISLKDTGTYSVITSYKNTCSEEGTSEKVKIILSNGSTPLKIKSNSKEACEGESIKLEIEDPAITPDWYFGNTFLGNSKNTLAEKSGDYIAKKGGGTSGCPSVEDKISLLFVPRPVLPLPDPAYIFCPGSIIPIETLNDNQLRYQWFKSGIAMNGTEYNRFVLNVKEKGIYTVLVETAGFHCTVESEPYVVSYDPSCDPMNPANALYFPNSFTPNNDGINDTWELINFDKYPGCTISIYDGWGNKIYEGVEFWDGKYNGKIVPVGMYNYIIKSPDIYKKGGVYVIY